MQYTSFYRSPLGRLLLAADHGGLTGAWFEGQKYYAHSLSPTALSQELPVFIAAKQWLDQYFAGYRPAPFPCLHLTGTPFQCQVWQRLSLIPYGETMSYGEIAREMAHAKGVSHFSAQAVGGAVGRNKLSVFIPCHRVIGTDGALTGYAGGLDRKYALLQLEQQDRSAK